MILFIAINKEQWSNSADRFFTKKRIYLKWRWLCKIFKGIWTPFVIVRWRNYKFNAMCKDCGRSDAVKYNRFNNVTQCHSCGSQNILFL